MPMILKSVDQIMDAEKRDMYLIDFGQFLFDCDKQLRSKRRREHRERFGSKGLRYALAALQGWLEGDPGV